MSDRIGVAISPDEYRLPPGATADVTILVTNQGDVVDEFSLRIDGVDPSWTEVTVPTASLFPGLAGNLQATLRIPPGAQARAGDYRVRFIAVSRNDPRDTTAAELRLEVLPFGDLTLELAPQQVLTTTVARYRAMLSNPSNQEQVVDLRFRDDDEALVYTSDADRIALEPLTATEVTFGARPRRKPPAGTTARYIITVGVYPAGDDVAEPLLSSFVTMAFESEIPAWRRYVPNLRTLILIAAGSLIVVAALVAYFRVPVQSIGTPGAGTVAGGATQAAVAVAPETPTSFGLTTPGVPTPIVLAQPTPVRAATGTLPTIVSFELKSPPNSARGEFELSWQVDDAQAVDINGQPQPLAGGMRVQAVDDRQFDLTATNQNGSVTKSVGVVVLRPPEIVEFKAEPETVAPGQSTTLSWEVRRADVASLNQQVVEPDRGTREVRPDRDTVFTLQVENDLGRVERSVLVRVQSQPGT